MYGNHLCTACTVTVLLNNQSLIFATQPAAPAVAGPGCHCLLRLSFLAGSLHRGLVVEQLHVLLKLFLRPQARYFQPASIQAMAKLHSRRFLVLGGRNPAKCWDSTCLFLQVNLTSQHLVVVACLFDLDDDLASESIRFPQSFIFHQHNSAERKNFQATLFDLLSSEDLVGVREHQLRYFQQAFPAGIFSDIRLLPTSGYNRFKYTGNQNLLYCMVMVKSNMQKMQKRLPCNIVGKKRRSMKHEC